MIFGNFTIYVRGTIPLQPTKQSPWEAHSMIDRGPGNQHHNPTTCLCFRAPLLSELAELFKYLEFCVYAGFETLCLCTCSGALNDMYRRRQGSISA